MKGLISEEIRPASGFVILDSAGPRETARLDVRSDSRNRFQFRVETGSGTTLSFKVLQHTLNSGGETKDVILETPQFYRVDGGPWQKIEPSGVATVSIADLDTASGIVAIDIEPSSLEDGYRWCSLEVSAFGGSRLSYCSMESNHDYRPAASVLN